MRQAFAERRPIERVRMIEINGRARRRCEIRQIAIKRILANARRLVRPKLFNEFLAEPALAAATASDDPHDHRSSITNFLL